MRVVCVLSLLFYRWGGGKHRKEKKKYYPRSARGLTASLTVAADLQIFCTFNKWFLILHLTPKLSLFGRFTFLIHYISLPLFPVAV